MKKSLLLFTIPALAMVSCSSDETVNAPKGDGINFRASVETTSRGALTTTATVKDFAVTSFGESQPSNYFNDVLVARDGNAWKSDLYYWPSFDLKFYAYSPSAVNGKVVINKDVKQMQDFAVEPKTADQVDLLYAANAYPNSANKDGVDIKFSHAMSAITINARVTNPTLEYEINAVKICQLKSKGTFTYPSVAGSNCRTYNNTSWAVLSDPSDYISKIEYGPRANIKMNADMFNMNDTHPEGMSIMKETDGSFIMIPQNLNPWTCTMDKIDGAYISLLCRIYTRDNKGGRTQIYPVPEDDNEGQYAFTAMPLNIAFQPGYKYTIRLDLNGAGYYDPNPTNPDDPGDEDIDPTPWPGDDPNPPFPPKPFPDGTISYTVSVLDWHNAGVNSVTFDQNANQ